MTERSLAKLRRILKQVNVNFLSSYGKCRAEQEKATSHLIFDTGIMQMWDSVHKKVSIDVPYSRVENLTEMVLKELSRHNSDDLITIDDHHCILFTGKE